MTRTPLQEGLQAGVGFAVIYGLLMWFLDWREDTPWLAAVAWAGLGGVLFGLWTAWYTKRRQKQGRS